MRRQRKPQLHFTAVVLSGFFLLSGVLTLRGSRNIWELEPANYRDSTMEGEERVKEPILNWKDNYFILEGGCFFLILNKHNFSSYQL